MFDSLSKKLNKLWPLSEEQICSFAELLNENAGQTNAKIQFALIFSLFSNFYILIFVAFAVRAANQYR